MLRRRDLGAVRFPAAFCERLFEAVLIDDDIDPDLELPRTVPLDHDPATLAACFGLARQMWRDGFDWAELRALVDTLLHERDLPPDERVRFKHIRARFKHLRYAHSLYDSRHRYPRVLDWLTTAMGKAQDAYRSGDPALVRRRARVLRLLVGEPAAWRVRAECDQIRLTSSADFRALLLADYRHLAGLLTAPSVTGHAFHAARKRVGRQVSFWDTLRTLEESEERWRMSRWLSAINGSMGALHDRLAEGRLADAASYHRPFELPADIRGLIASLVEVAGRAG